MIRFLLRFLGLWILAAAFVWLVIDGTKSIAGNAVYFTQLGKTWYELNPNSLQLLQPAIERHVGSAGRSASAESAPSSDRCWAA